MTGLKMPAGQRADPSIRVMEANGSFTMLRRPPESRRDPLACIAVGASTGGVLALSAFLTALPPEIDAPILITQHLPAPFIPGFAAQLGNLAGRPARVGTDGLALARGEIVLAPGDTHLGVARCNGVVCVRLSRGSAPSGARPSVDPMLASIAHAFGPGAAAVILSGMGRDGLIGAQALAEAGGAVLAQDAASSVVWGMPGAVVASGLADAALPPAALARWIGRWGTRAGDGLWK